MISTTIDRVLARLIASAALSALLFLVTMLVSVGWIRLIWLLPGRAVAPIFAAVLPHTWVTGDLTSEAHWHVASDGGFAFGCGLLFWAVIILGSVPWRGLKDVAGGLYRESALGRGACSDGVCFKGAAHPIMSTKR